MSNHDMARLVPVAELLRREGHEQAQASRAKRIAIATGGMAALCGATVSGMLALAPTLSTSLFPADPETVATGPGSKSGSSASQSDRAGEASSGAREILAAGPVAPARQVPALSLIAPDLRQSAGSGAAARSTSAPATGESGGQRAAASGESGGAADSAYRAESSESAPATGEESEEQSADTYSSGESGDPAGEPESEPAESEPTESEPAESEPAESEPAEPESDGASGDETGETGESQKGKKAKGE